MNGTRVWLQVLACQLMDQENMGGITWNISAVYGHFNIIILSIW